MNKKDKALFGIFGVILFCVQSIKANEPTTIENLNATSVKISEIDMNKDFSKAGNVLDNFYTGTISKRGTESSAVYADATTANNTSAPTSNICNAKPSKITLSGKVPPIQSKSDSNKRNSTEVPPQTGALAIGAVALALALRKNGGTKSYGEDLDTVVDFLVDLVTPSGSGSQQTTGSSQTTSTNTVVNVNNSSGTVTTSTATDNSCSQGNPGCYGSGYVHQQVPTYPRP